MRILSFLIAFFALSTSANAFCGFYVARADGELFNEASKVVFVRNGRKSVITMSSDYRGPAADFAMIVPSPKVLQRNQISTVRAETIAHLDAYSAPRLVEYNDEDPCAPDILVEPVMVMESASDTRRRGPKALGVTVEAEYAVGVYDIAVLSAKESDGLVTYLRQEGYKIPDGAELVLADYIADKMKFFVARVNLKRHDAGGAQELPPLQISFRSPKFMLPLQLGKINSDAEQQVLLLTLTKQGRVEAANYKNTRIPSNMTVPVFVEDVFGEFYTRLFETTAKPNTVVTEYAWDMAWCDPCAADPLSTKELRELGVNWVKSTGDTAGQDVFVTRLHFRYDKSGFQRDLLLKVTDDRDNFQGRYVMQHPYGDTFQCDAQDYVSATRKRLRDEAVRLRQLTSWSKREIDQRIRQSVPAVYRY